MDFSKIPLFAMSKHKLDYHAERQRVLAENIANANTPGFQAKDLKPLDFGKILDEKRMNISMTATNANHMQAGGLSAFKENKKLRYFETKPINNAVDAIEETQKMQQNAAANDETLSIMRKYAEMFRLAAGSRS